MERVEALQRSGNEIDLLHVDPTVSAGCQMQIDQHFGQAEKAIIQILGGSIRHTAARESAAGPL
jgi:hypothetical protein